MPPTTALDQLAHYAAPSRRRLRVFSVDPTYSRLQGETVVLSVPWERLLPGPRGARIEVVDWSEQGPAPQVRLDDPRLLAQDGLAPDQSDPQFRQQMVYAVLASLLETLDRARGRRLQWRNIWRGAEDSGRRVPAVRPLRVVANQPGLANAHFTPGEGLTFGSYVATSDLAAGVFPGQRVYACLSHDIVNHEAGHAFLHELRPLAMEALGPDALAFHEALGDLLAILQHFQLPGLLEAAMTRSGLAIWERGPFVELAGEFGRGVGPRQPVPGSGAQSGPAPAGRIDAVRRALDPADEPTVLADDLTEPHARAAVLVAAVFEAFFAAYTHRVAPLLRAAGHPVPAAGADQLRAHHGSEGLSADLLRLACDEARRAAATTMTMVVRAIDYLPPAAIRFGDFLDAVVLADSDLNPEDRDGFRRQFVEACRRRNIQPIATHPDAGGGAVPAPRAPLPAEPALLAATLDLGDALRLGTRAPRSAAPPAGAWHREVLRWARDGFEELGLAAFGLTPDGMAVDGGNASFRVDQDGFPTAVVTARITQRNVAGEAALPPALGRLRLFGGVTLVAHPDGRLRHVIGRPVPGVGVAGLALLDQLVAQPTPIGAPSLPCLPAPLAAGATIPTARGQ